MAAEIQAKGTAFAGVIAAMKSNIPRYRGLLRAELHHYLDEDVLVSAWYSMDDYLELLQTLASSLDPKSVGGDPYRAFGLIAARRDLKGTQTHVPQNQRVDRAGLYKSAIDHGRGLSGRIRRALWLRSLYYSKGHYEARRSGERSLRLTLCDFPVVSAQLCAMSTGYLIEVFHDPPKGWLDKVSCRARGHNACEWELRFDEHADPKDLDPFGPDPTRKPAKG
jgi:hypothetical protein